MIKLVESVAVETLVSQLEDRMANIEIHQNMVQTAISQHIRFQLIDSGNPEYDNMLKSFAHTPEHMLYLPTMCVGCQLLQERSWILQGSLQSLSQLHTDLIDQV